MANKSKVLQAYEFLKRNWSAIASFTSLTGFVFCYIIPPLREHTWAFVFIGANAIMWTLVELKIHLLTKEKLHRFPTMRDARPEITSSIIRSLSKKKQTTITIVGGRIRTISDIVREISGAIESGTIQARNSKIVICCIDPECVSKTVPKESLISPQIFADRFSGYKKIVDQFCSELRDLNEITEFKQNKITVEVFIYQESPHFYGYLIEDIGLFWGHYTWNERIEDFVGPTNPCYFIDTKSETYEDFHSWFKNRSSFYIMTSPKEANEICAKDIQEKGATS